MNRTILFILALAGIFAVSCATDNVDGSESAIVDAAMLKKFVNTSNDAVKGELIIYVDEATAEQLEGAEVATRSGVTAFDEVLMEIGAENLKPVFNLKVNAERKRERGMHRWYAVSISEDADLDVAAKTTSRSASTSAADWPRHTSLPRWMSTTPTTLCLSKSAIWLPMSMAPP
ncbi:MAG: hypothetical protein IIV52_02490, partial [Alistipes sp.]|nr:hypothetical protein [Alistipes sp.]